MTRKPSVTGHYLGREREQAVDDADEPMNLESTYVLDETSITKTKTIEELAELALRGTEERDAEASTKKERAEDAFDWDELE